MFAHCDLTAIPDSLWAILIILLIVLVVLRIVDAFR